MRPWPIVACLALLPVISGAALLDESVEMRGDFHYNAEGAPIAVRHVSLPDGFERVPMSHREKFELVGIELPERPAVLLPRPVQPKPDGVEASERVLANRVVIKFAEGTPVRLRGGRLTAPGAYLTPVEAVLARYPDGELVRAFSTEERILDEDKETGERIGGRELADLNNYYLVRFPAGSERGVALANELLALDEIETAYLLHHAEAPACEDVSPPTPSFEAQQFYLDPAPTGVDAFFAWSYHPGGNGAGPDFWVVDCEWAWCFTHEDLDISSADVVNGSTDNTGPNHGTAVLGEIGSCNNEYGTTGISYDVQLKMSDFDSEPTWGSNIAAAASAVTAGEVILLEIHIWGPDTGQTCVCNCGQFEFVPVEWDPASYDAIATASANGVIVVEAAGNGSMNLDQGVYGGAFDRMIRDSGAIMVGAGQPGSHSPECWTNHGRRVDIHGYGSDVTTSGYGDRFDQSGCTQDYTGTFGGTSSASPIVVGVCASVQGVANEKYGFDLMPLQMRSLIGTNGTPQGAPTTKIIRNMPDLAEVLIALENAVDAPDVAPGPTAFALDVPRPNPLRDESVVRFSVPVNGAGVRLTVHDVSGRQVRELRTGAQPAGTHQVRWDGRDSAGEPVAAGLYFVRLETERGVETRKLTVLR